LDAIQAGDSVTAVSYADAFKTLTARNGESAEAVLRRFPQPEPVDEVYLKRKPGKKEEERPLPVKKDEPTSVRTVLYTAIGIVLGLVLVFFSLPAIVFAYYKSRASGAKNNDSKAYWTYRAASFYLHQLGFERGKRTPMQYASETIDPALGTSFAGFMNAYLKIKYAKQALTPAEEQRVVAFLPALMTQVRSRLKGGKRMGAFLHPLRTISFFVQPAEDDGVNDQRQTS
jgi:hypothetical protein